MAKFATEITVNCPYCGSERVVKNGKGRTDKVQRYLCRGCEKRFSSQGVIDSNRYHANQIGAAIRAFYSGMSYKQIAENMTEVHDIPEPSKRTIYRWVKEYTQDALREMDNHKAQTGDSWVADEMQVTVGGRKYWNWNVMDSKTRYILASHLSRRRDTRAATTVMRKAQKAAANTPKTVKTDKLKSYIGAIEDVWGGDVKHVQSEGIRAELNNNLSERLQGTYRARTKTLRGLDNKESGQVYLDGWTLTYNLFRKHEALDNKTPASAAKVSTPFKSWESVVDGSARRQRVEVNLEPVQPESGTAQRVEAKPVELVETDKPKRSETASATKTRTPKAKPVTPKPKRSPVRNTVPYHPFLSRREGRHRRRR